MLAHEYDENLPSLYTSPVGMTLGPPNENGNDEEKPENDLRRTKSLQLIGCLFKTAQLIPFFLAVGIMTFAYFNYLATVLGHWVKPTSLKVLYCVLMQILNVMTLWTFIKVVVTNPGTVPKEFVVGYQHHVVNADGVVVAIDSSAYSPVRTYTCDRSGGARFCYRCNVLKPDRTHHCSLCGRCILKMDHHCPWVANCIGFKNYKYYYLFLLYSGLLALFYFSTTLPFIIEIFQSSMMVEQMPVLLFVECCLAAMLGLGIWSLFAHHTYFILKNLTTVESFHLPYFKVATVNKNAFNLGWRANVRLTLGPISWKILLPVANWEGDGLEFPIGPLSDEESVIGGELIDAPSHHVGGYVQNRS